MLNQPQINTNIQKEQQNFAAFQLGNFSDDGLLTIGADDEFFYNLRDTGTFTNHIQHDGECHLYNGSFFESQFALADSLQTFSSIGIVSRDLLISPVISSGFRQALLHQFPLPYDFGLGFEKDFAVSGSSHTPPGRLAWRTRGFLLPHKIQMGASPLNRFSVSAVLRPKNNEIPPVEIVLPPHGEFTLQLLLFKNIHSG